MAISIQTRQLLQELYIFATGQAANTSEMAMIEALVGEDGSLNKINDLIDTYINQQAQQHGVAGMVKILAKNGMGVNLTDAEASAAIADFTAAGLTTWSSLFQWAAANESTYGVILSNRGDAASYFTNALANADKTSFFAGTSIDTAVSNLLKTISGTLSSVSTAQQGLDELVARLTENGLTSAVVDGYLAGATIFADANGNGVLDADEWSSTTDENGNYVLPADLPAGALIAFGGTDLLTGQAFQGVLSAPAGSTVVTPLTSMIQALLENDPDTDISAATNAVRSALNLPEDVDLQTYDPIAVLNNGDASDAAKAKALAVQNVSLQVANVLTQAGNALSAANGGTTLQSATGAVTKALATALSGGGTFDLGSQTTLSTVLSSAANASASPLTTEQINQITTVTAQSNTAAAGATSINDLAKVAVVAQGSATTSIISGTTNNTLDSTVSNFTGTNFSNNVEAANPSNVPGTPPAPAPAPAPAPEPTPPPSFFATINAATEELSFSGTVTGDISVVIASDNVTFSRGGLTATTLENYDDDGYRIILASGQTLTSSYTNLSKLGTYTGAGNVIVTGTPSIQELSQLDVSGLTGTFTYSHVKDSGSNLDQASDSIYENTAVDVTVVYGSSPTSVAQLNQIDALWGTVTYTHITDSSANLAANAGGYVTGAVDLTIVGSATIDQLTTIRALTSGSISIPEISDSAANIAASTIVSTTTPVTLTAGTAAVADLISIDGMTTEAVNASAITTLTGTAAQITAAYAANTAGTITGLGNETVTASDSGSVAATVLTSLDALTSGVADFASVTTLTGTAAQITAAYAANTAGTITGLGDEIVTANDSGSIAATALTDLDALTTGVVDFSSVTTLTGTAAQITAAYAGNTAGTITGLGNETVTASDSGTVAATVLTSLDDLTTGAAAFSSVTTLTGTAAQITAAYAANTAGTITGLGDEIVTANDSGSIAATALTDLDALTTGAADFTSVTTLTGTATQITAAYDANTAGTITGLGNETVTASDSGSVAATVLSSLDALTSGVADFASVTTLTGTAAQITAAYAANTAGTITGLGDEIVTANDSGSIAATALTDLDALTTGVVDFSSVTTLTGTAAQITAAYAGNTAGTITGLGNETVTASDSGTVAATVLTSLDDLTTGAAAFSSVTTLTGTAAQITAAYAANTAGTITGLGDEIVTANDSGSIAATALTDLDALTTGAADFTSVTTLTGTAAQITAAYAANTAGTITGLGNETVTASDSGSVAATVLSSLDVLTTGAVDFSSVTTLTGTGAQITDAYTANTIGTITGLGDESVTASDSGFIAATVLTNLDALTTGAVDFASVTTLTGTAAQITAAYAANSAGTITGLGDEAVIALDFGSIAATALTDLDAQTTGILGFATISTVTGTAAQIAAAYTANTAGTISGLGNEAITLSGSVSATDISAIKAGNASGTINGAAITDITGSASEVIKALADLDTSPTNFNTALTGSVSKADRDTLMAADGTGTVDDSGITTLVVTGDEDISSYTWAATATTLDATAVAAIKITMSVAQHNAFTTAINANGADDTISLTDTGTFTAAADIKNYTLGRGANNVTTGSDGQIFKEHGTFSNTVLTLSGSHSASIELNSVGLSASSATGAITVTESASTAAGATITTGSGDDIIIGGASGDTMDGGAGDDIFLITANGDFGRFFPDTIEGGTHNSGDTLRITGTTESYLSKGSISGVEILDLTTSAAVQTVHITASQLAAFTTVNVDASDVLYISALTGSSINHTAAVDHFSLDDADVNVSITSFNTAVDQVGFSGRNHPGGKAEVTGSISASDNGKIWFLNSGNAGDADSLASSAAALSAAAVWGAPAGNYTNYVVLADDDSTALYKLNDVSGSTDEIISSEITLIGVVNDVLGLGNINTSIVPPDLGPLA